MAPGCINILMHHGGAFSKHGELTYDGGDITLFPKIKMDKMSYYRLVQLRMKTVGNGRKTSQPFSTSTF